MKIHNGKVLAFIFQEDLDICNAIVIEWIRRVHSNGQSGLNTFCLGMNAIYNKNQAVIQKYQSMQDILSHNKMEFIVHGRALEKNYKELNEKGSWVASKRVFMARDALNKLPQSLQAAGIKTERILDNTEMKSEQNVTDIIFRLTAGMYRISLGGRGKGHAVGISIPYNALTGLFYTMPRCFLDPTTGLFEFGDSVGFINFIGNYWEKFFMVDYSSWEIDKYYTTFF